MAETANFTYEGNAVLKISGNTQAATQLLDIEVLDVQHLIPISVRAKIGGKETVIGGYVDYTDKSVSIPSSELAFTGVTEPQFSKAVQQFLTDRVEQQMADAEEEHTRMAQENYRMAQVDQAIAFAAAHAAVDIDDDE
jgi:hypothetical protein